jgi:uncharacterized protein YegL
MSEQKKVTTTTVTTTTVTEEIIQDVKKVVETHYLLILDKSGSMSSVRQETINNFNEQVQTIKKLEAQYPDQKYFVSLITFSDGMEEVMMDIPAAEVKELTQDDYVPGGMTALYHAMGQGISKLKDKITPRMTDTSKIVSSVVVVMTDGGENNSQAHPEKWTSERLKPLVESLNKDDRWTISFLGANQDAVLTSSQVGINIGNTLNYASTTKGTSTVTKAMKATLSKRAADISGGYSTLVGGTVDNAVYFSSVLDTQSLGEEEDLNLKNNSSDSSKN